MTLARLGIILTLSLLGWCVIIMLVYMAGADLGVWGRG